MKKLTAKRCREKIEMWERLERDYCLATTAEDHLQAYRIALPVLEQQEKDELVRVAFTGSGSLAAIKRGDEGFIWGSKEDAHPIELFARCRDVVCEKCNGTGQMDSGGTQPWGEKILVECDCVVEQQEKGNDVWIDWRGNGPTVALLGKTVKVRYQDNDTDVGPSSHFYWFNNCGNPIIAYRVIENDGREG